MLPVDLLSLPAHHDLQRLSDNGRCSTFASSEGAASGRRSSSVVSITGHGLRVDRLGDSIAAVARNIDVNSGRPSLNANQTTRFFFLRVGSGACSAKLSAGTKQSVLWISHFPPV